MTDGPDLETLVRKRLRELRVALNYSLDDLAERLHLSPSTISRIETGKRSIGLDVLLPLAGALHTSVDRLLDTTDDDDVVIRPVPSHTGKRTTWQLSRPDSPTTVIKMRLEPLKGRPEQKVHPGYDWFFVTDGSVRLLLGEREILVDAGEAAEFATMTPHAISATDGPAEVVMIFDRDGRRAHVHR